ncbi:MAG: GNAT family N-acetyltransferase [Bacteroidales bacterium]|jgi:diamine N-acetyltransferase|nr:GNAT family N-acetyltransferase [Bacteroidales bacterium]
MSGTTQKIKLRPIEPEDIDILYEWENNPTNWEVSNTRLPFSKEILRRYIQNAQDEMYISGQVRLVICFEKEKKAIGFVDLFDLDLFHQRAGIGILIEESFRGKDYGKAAIQEIINYGFLHLGLHQLYSNISEDNDASIQLFKSLGFEQCGLKKAWNRTSNGFKDELMFQLIKAE